MTLNLQDSRCRKWIRLFSRQQAPWIRTIRSMSSRPRAAGSDWYFKIPRCGMDCFTWQDPCTSLGKSSPWMGTTSCMRTGGAHGADLNPWRWNHLSSSACFRWHWCWPTTQSVPQRCPQKNKDHVSKSKFVDFVNLNISNCVPIIFNKILQHIQNGTSPQISKPSTKPPRIFFGTSWLSCS